MDTSDFQPTPLPRAPWEIPKPHIPQPDPADEANAEDEASGGIAHADPEMETDEETWIAPIKVDDPNHQWNDLNCMLVLTEHGVHMHLKNRGLSSLAELLDVIPE